MNWTNPDPLCVDALEGHVCDHIGDHVRDPN